MILPQWFWFNKFLENLRNASSLLNIYFYFIDNLILNIWHILVLIMYLSNNIFLRTWLMIICSWIVPVGDNMWNSKLLVTNRLDPCAVSEPRRIAGRSYRNGNNEVLFLFPWDIQKIKVHYSYFYDAGRKGWY